MILAYSCRQLGRQRFYGVVACPSRHSLLSTVKTYRTREHAKEAAFRLSFWKPIGLWLVV